MDEEASSITGYGVLTGRSTVPDGVRRTSNCCGDTAPVDAMQSGVMCSSPPARRCWPARVRQLSTRVLFCTSAHRVPCAVLARCALCSSCTTKVRASNRLLMCPGAALGPHFPLAKLMPSAASLPRDEALGFLGWGRVTALPPSHVAAQGGQRAARSTDGIRLHRAETELSHLPYPPIHPFHSTRHSACPRLFVFFVRARFAASTENTLTSPPSPFFFSFRRQRCLRQDLDGASAASTSRATAQRLSKRGVRLARLIGRPGSLRH